MADNGRRKSVRTPRRYKVNIRPGGEGRAGQSLVCFTMNVGTGGFAVHSARVLAPGTLVTGTIESDGTPLPFTGSVSWAQAGDVRLGVMGRMGIRFTAGA